MNEDGREQGEFVDLYAPERAYRSVRAILSDDHNYEQGLCAAREIVGGVLAESGVDGLAEVAVELALKLASALERIAVEQRLAAVDLAEVWFVD